MLAASLLVAGLLSPAFAATGFTPGQIFFLTNDDQTKGPLGSEVRVQYFYHYLKKDRDPKLNQIIPAWIDPALDAMIRHPVWRDPEEGVLNEAQLWQAPAAVLYEFYQTTRKTFPPDRKGSLTPPAVLLHDYEDSRTRFQMALDRLYRAGPPTKGDMFNSLGGRGRAVLASFDLILKEMDSLLDGLTSQDNKRYIDSVLAIGALTNQAYGLMHQPPRGWAPEQAPSAIHDAAAILLKMLGMLVVFIAAWSLSAMNQDRIGQEWEDFGKRSRVWAQEFNRQFVQIKVQYLVILPMIIGLLLGISTLNPFTFMIFTGMGVFVGLRAPMWLLTYIRTRRGKKVEAQLMDAMILLSNALKSGLDIVQGFELVSRDLTPPISEEFGLVIKNYQLGTPFEKALEGMEERIASRLLSYVIKAIVIQRSVGGNITKIFDRIVENIRDEGKLEEKVQSLTAQQRIQSIVVAVMPWLMWALMFAFQPEAMKNYYGTLLGFVTILFCVFWASIGVGIVRKLADIQV